MFVHKIMKKATCKCISCFHLESNIFMIKFVLLSNDQIMKIDPVNLVRSCIGFFWHNLEAFIWLAALISLAFHDPALAHYSLCPLKNLGIGFCPGCGLGHAISYFFQGKILLSLETHPLGIIALVLLSYRIISIIRKNILYQKSHNIIRNG